MHAHASAAEQIAFVFADPAWRVFQRIDPVDIESLRRFAQLIQAIQCAAGVDRGVGDEQRVRDRLLRRERLLLAVCRRLRRPPL